MRFTYLPAIFLVLLPVLSQGALAQAGDAFATSSGFERRWSKLDLSAQRPNRERYLRIVARRANQLWRRAKCPPLPPVIAHFVDGRVTVLPAGPAAVDLSEYTLDMSKKQRVYIEELFRGTVRNEVELAAARRYLGGLADSPGLVPLFNHRQDQLREYSKKAGTAVKIVQSSLSAKVPRSGAFDSTFHFVPMNGSNSSLRGELMGQDNSLGARSIEHVAHHPQSHQNQPPAPRPQPTSAPRGTVSTDVDFGPYMSALQRRIKKNWMPPKSSEAVKVVVVFKIHSGGELSDLRIDSPVDTSSRAQKFALQAVEDSAPFSPLPAGAPDSVDIQFSFGYVNMDRDAILREARMGKRSENGPTPNYDVAVFAPPDFDISLPSR